MNFLALLYLIRKRRKKICQKGELKGVHFNEKLKKLLQTNSNEYIFSLNSELFNLDERDFLNLSFFLFWKFERNNKINIPPEILNNLRNLRKFTYKYKNRYLSDNIDSHRTLNPVDCRKQRSMGFFRAYNPWSEEEKDDLVNIFNIVDETLRNDTFKYIGHITNEPYAIEEEIFVHLIHWISSILRRHPSAIIFNLLNGGFPMGEGVCEERRKLKCGEKCDIHNKKYNSNRFPSPCSKCWEKMYNYFSQYFIDVKTELFPNS